MDEEEYDMDGFIEEEEESLGMCTPEMSKSGSKMEEIISEPMKIGEADYKVEVITKSNVLSMIKGKILELQSKFEFADIDKSVFWAFLRDNNYLLKISVSKLEDKIFDIMETVPCKELPKGTSLMCNILGDMLEPHEISHFGCGHTFSKECLKDYIHREITARGRNSILSTCPYDGCCFGITEEIVSNFCDPEFVERFQNFMVLDFLDRYPCLAKCTNPLCELYLVVPESALNSKGEIRAKDSCCSCGRLVCHSCKFQGHQPISCSMAKDWSQEMEASVDKLNLAWKKTNTKKCPNCKVDVYKNSGCMHMVCTKCKHSFCWVCLREPKNHGSNHIASCNNPPPEIEEKMNNQSDDESAKEMSRLQFCISRFMDSEHSLKLLYSQFDELIQSITKESQTLQIVFKFLQRFPGSLDFYIDCFKDLILARSFMTHTFPLQYTIKNQQQILLFFESQSLFQVSLENMTALMEKNPPESFITDMNQMVYPTEDFNQRKEDILALRAGLNKHLRGLKAELSDERYISMMKKEVKADHTKIIKDKGYIHAKLAPEKEENWTCIFCLKGGVKGSSMCQTCQRNTYAESYGFWVCPFCSNPQSRANETCSNGYCMKGKRPKEASGFWTCSLCSFPNTKNLSNVCKACNQQGRQ